MIGYGGYGQVWNPPRNDPLFPQKYKNENFIQRYTDQSMQQIKMGEKARRIFDPSNNMSSPVLEIFPRQNGFYSEIMPFRQKKFQDLLEENRGQNKIFWKTLTKMVPIVKGLIRLHKQKMIHRDIKRYNLVYDETPEFKVYLIDWGTSAYFEEVYSPKNSHWWSASIENIPPEYKMFTHFKGHHEYERGDICVDFFRNQLKNLLLFIDPKYCVKLKKADLNFQDEMMHSPNKQKILEKIADKVDIFALGIVFSQMFGEMVDKLKMPSFLKKKVINLLQHMIDPDPFTRWTAQKVLKDVVQILKARKMLYSKK